MRQALIVVDMQKDFIDGALGTAQAVAILPNVAAKLAAARQAGQAIYFTRDTHHADYLTTQEGRNLPVPHCIKDSAGWQIDKTLPTADAVIVDKPTFGSERLAEKLAADHAADPFEKITLVGLCTDICVISNALLIKAFLPEVPLAVDATCCAGVTPQSHQTALAAMQACQIEIAPKTATE